MTEVFTIEVNSGNMSCIGKKHGYTCATCLIRSWCDGIPLKEVY